jgi:hypothetical protein
MTFLVWCIGIMVAFLGLQFAHHAAPGWVWPWRLMLAAYLAFGPFYVLFWIGKRIASSIQTAQQRGKDGTSS